MTFRPFIDGDRLWSRHQVMDTIGGTSGGGVHRLALNEADIAAHRRLADWAAPLGWQIRLDAIGNMFLIRPGAEELSPVMAGSHTDSQPMGGRFDGMTGVLTAFEALEAIHHHGIETRRPIAVAVWNNEEGPRFSPACMGSAVYAGVRRLEDLIDQTDADGITLRACIEDLRAAIPEASEQSLGEVPSAFLEAHIEQGVELEQSGRVIGIVTGMQGYRRWTIDVTGEEAHSGASAVSRRKDAFVAATDMAVAMRREFADPTDELRFTVGRFEVRPGGISVVPGHVHFTVDMRHPSNEVLQRLGDWVPEICRANAGPCGVAVDEFITSASMTFDEGIRGLFADAADRHGFPHQPVFSRASHDARHLSRLCPAGMIFIPCKDGISHNEAESAEKDHCAAAAQILADVMIELAEAV